MNIASKDLHLSRTDLIEALGHLEQAMAVFEGARGPLCGEEIRVKSVLSVVRRELQEFLSGRGRLEPPLVAARDWPSGTGH